LALAPALLAHKFASAAQTEICCGGSACLHHPTWLKLSPLPGSHFSGCCMIMSLCLNLGHLPCWHAYNKNSNNNNTNDSLNGNDSDNHNHDNNHDNDNDNDNDDNNDNNNTNNNNSDKSPSSLLACLMQDSQMVLCSHAGWRFLIQYQKQGGARSDKSHTI